MSIPPSSCSRVDLPLPDGPTMATCSPRQTESETPRSAWTVSPSIGIVLPQVVGDEYRLGVDRSAQVASARNVAAMGARAASQAG